MLPPNEEGPENTRRSSLEECQKCANIQGGIGK